MLADQARSAGLLGAVLRDLKPLDYEVPDARYLKLLDEALGIFDAARSRAIPIETRIEAADALGQSGDPGWGPAIPSATSRSRREASGWAPQNREPWKPNHDPEAYDDEGSVSVVALGAYRIGAIRSRSRNIGVFSKVAAMPIPATGRPAVTGAGRHLTPESQRGEPPLAARGWRGTRVSMGGLSAPMRVTTRVSKALRV